METQIDVSVALRNSEIAYRRGCHQTLAMVNDDKLSQEELGRMEDIVQEMRNSGKPQHLFLHEALRRLRS